MTIRQGHEHAAGNVEQTVGDIGRTTRRRFSAEEKITEVGNDISLRYEQGPGKPAVGSSQEERMALLDIDPRPDKLTVNMGTFHMSTMVLSMGGNIRAGSDNNVCCGHGVLALSNAHFVQHAVRVAREPGRMIATPEEAREMMQMHAAATSTRAGIHARAAANSARL